MSGQLRHRVWLRRRHESQDEINATIYSYPRTSELWAEVVPTGMTEVSVGDKLVSRTVFEVRMRYNDAVTNHDRLEFDGRQLEISAVIDIGNRHREMLLTCVEAA